MQIIHFIALLMTIVANAAMTFLVGYTITRLRRLSSDVNELQNDVHVTLSIAMGEHIRNEVDALNGMKERLAELLKEERFKEAGHLKNIIDEQEHTVRQAIAGFKKTFGECNVKVEETKFRVS